MLTTYRLYKDNPSLVEFSSLSLLERASKLVDIKLRRILRHGIAIREKIEICLLFGAEYYVEAVMVFYLKMVLIRIIIHVSMVVFKAFLTASPFVCTQISSITIELRFDLGTLALRFASASNFESVPRFAEICLLLISHTHTYHFYNENF